DGRQRRAQLVAQGGQELVLGAVGGFGLLARGLLGGEQALALLLGAEQRAEQLGLADAVARLAEEPDAPVVGAVRPDERRAVAVIGAPVLEVHGVHAGLAA